LLVIVVRHSSCDGLTLMFLSWPMYSPGCFLPTYNPAGVLLQILLRLSGGVRGVARVLTRPAATPDGSSAVPLVIGLLIDPGIGRVAASTKIPRPVTRVPVQRVTAILTVGRSRIHRRAGEICCEWCGDPGRRGAPREDVGAEQPPLPKSRVVPDEFFVITTSGPKAD
jgi:hypothetical protein